MDKLILSLALARFVGAWVGFVIGALAAHRVACVSVRSWKVRALYAALFVAGDAVLYAYALRGGEDSRAWVIFDPVWVVSTRAGYAFSAVCAVLWAVRAAKWIKLRSAIV